MDETQFASPEFAFPIDVRVIFAEQWKEGEFGANGELLPEDVRQYFLTGKGTLPKSYIRRRPNGTVLEVRTEFLPSGGMVQSYTDITELVAAKEAAEAGARAKSAFLATMSHEIRTPLTGVLGMAALLRRSGLSSEQTEYVETIRSCGDALLSIIDDILSFSKLESGRVEIEPAPFGLGRLVMRSQRSSTSFWRTPAVCSTSWSAPRTACKRRNSSGCSNRSAKRQRHSGSPRERTNAGKPRLRLPIPRRRSPESAGRCSSTWR